MGLFENVASSSGEMHRLVTAAAGFGEDDILAPEARLHFRGAVGSAWRFAEASSKYKKIPNDEEEAGLVDAPIDLDRRTRMMGRFQDVYRFAIPVWGQPSDRTLSLVNHLLMGRSFEFAPFSAASSCSGQDSSWLLAPKKIAGADLLYAPADPARKSDLRTKSPPIFPPHSQGPNVFLRFGLGARP